VKLDNKKIGQILILQLKKVFLT